jgi:Cu+-exporting ATPase
MYMENEKSYSCEVAGMTCGNCALTVSKYLSKQGLKNISANAATGAVHFSADKEVDLNRIYQGIKGLGYQVIEKKEGDADRHDQNHHNHPGHNKLNFLLLVSALFTIPLLWHMFLPHTHPLNSPKLQLVLCIPVFAIGVYHFGLSAFRSLRNGIPNMDVLIILGATAAFVYSLAGMLLFSGQAHQYLFFETTATIITLVLLGNWIETRTVSATTTAIKSLARLQPDKAKIILTDSLGKETVLETQSKFIKMNDLLLVATGDRIPADGQVISGHAELDESMITGESLPASKEMGDSVVGGTLVHSGNLKIKATAIGENTALAEIIRLVQQAQAAKPPLQKLADKISAIFVPVVLGIALLTFLANYFLGDIPLAASIMRSVAVLVIACPCAMGLATPAAVAVGLGRAARNGILIKGGDTLEQFKNIRQVVFDKTGTLTSGNLTIQSFKAIGMEAGRFQSMVAAMEQYSSHPIAKSIGRKWKNTEGIILKNVAETKGLGISATDPSGAKWHIGSRKIVPEKYRDTHGFDLFLLRGEELMGGILLRDELRPDAVETIAKLHEQGFKTILLSGDHTEKSKQIGNLLQIDQVLAEQSPEDKMNQLAKLLKTAPTAMVGDGINDAPALAKADIGVSLSDATQVAIQSANVILSNNRLSSLPKAFRLGKFTYQTIKQNLFWAFFYNIFAIPLAAFGFLSPMWAAFFMAFSDIVLVLNSLRLNIRKIN